MRELAGAVKLAVVATLLNVVLTSVTVLVSSASVTG